MGIYIDGLDMPKKEPLPECHDLIIRTDGKVFIYGNFEDEFEAEQIDLVRCEECKYQYMCGHQINRHGLTLKLTCCEYGERRNDESNH